MMTTTLSNPTPSTLSTPPARPASTATAPTGARTRGWPRLCSVADGAALILSGLFAGFFLTYTMSVVRGLAVTDDVTYVAAFQGINDTIQNLEFAIVFFGTLPAILLAIAVNRGNGTTNQRVRSGAALLVFATITITFAGSIPLNRDLAEVTATDVLAAADARATFESLWNQLNLARTILAGLAFGLLAATRR